MSVDKFKFAGPSIQVAEIDESRIEQPIAGVGPVVIGRTAKGPAMAPVTVSTVAELERIFGAPYNGKTGVVDVWRDGNQLAPTYATYAAKAFLQNSSPVTVVRTLGTQNPENSSALAGWETSTITGSNYKTQGLYLFNSASTEISGTLVAVFHGVGGSGEGYLPFHLSASSDNMVANTLVKFSGSDIALTNLSTNPQVDRKYVVSFESSKSNFIRKVLNTDPTKAKGKAEAEYFLAETFESAAKQYTDSPSGYYAALVTLPYSASHARYSYQPAESGIVFGQHTNVKEAFTPDDTTGMYPVQELFKFVTLNGGEWEQSHIKVIIENIRPSAYPLSDPYGTFDVVLKDLYTEETLESYRGLNLNQNSTNYIAKAIGDMYYEWSYEEGRFKEVGLYPNKSARVRVEILDTISDPYQLPFGFYGPRAPKGKATNLSSSTSAFNDIVISVDGYTTITSISASYPSISLLDKNTKALSRTTWGFTYDKKSYDIKDLLRLNALTHETDKEVGYPTCFFSLDDIGPTGVGTFSKWELGLRKSGNSYSSKVGGDYTETLKYANSFAMPLFGGFDGVNIFEKEPIINNKELGSKSVETSYAYNTIDVALKSVSDKEVIETDIICVPGLTEPSLIQQLIDVCEQRGDAIALIDIENDYIPYHEDQDKTAKERLPDVKAAIADFKELNLDSTYAAAYYPAVYESVENVFLPATVAALGVMGGTEGNSALWFAPAGFIRGGISQSTAGLSVSRAAQHLTAKERDDLYNINVNPLATFPNEGVVVFGQKTLQAQPSALSRINVRRLMNYIKRNVSTVAKGVLFEPNVEATWNNFKNRVEPFLALVKTNFGLEDFRVILDSKTTTADLVDRNIMYAKILLKPTRTIEYIAVDFVITNSGAVFTA